MSSIDPRIAQLLAVRAAIKLERDTGLRHSKLGSVKTKWAKHLGMSARATFNDVIDRVSDEITKLEQQRESKSVQRRIDAQRGNGSDV
jgi:hypothetical protein